MPLPMKSEEINPIHTIQIGLAHRSQVSSPLEVAVEAEAADRTGAGENCVKGWVYIYIIRLVGGNNHSLSQLHMEYPHLKLYIPGGTPRMLSC